MRRSILRLGASIGYRTTVPSWCRLTQLFGNTASGQALGPGSSSAKVPTPAAAKASASASNSQSARWRRSPAGSATGCWKALLPAVWGFQPKAAGRTISTASADWRSFAPAAASAVWGSWSVAGWDMTGL
jgi:hypothetical protein